MVKIHLHLGQDVIVKNKDVLGIFDIDNTTVGKDTKTFLNTGEKKKKVVTITTDIPKTFIVVCKDKNNKKRKRRESFAHKKATDVENLDTQQQNHLKKDRTMEHTIYLSQMAASTLKKRTGYKF